MLGRPSDHRETPEIHVSSYIEKMGGGMAKKASTRITETNEKLPIETTDCKRLQSGVVGTSRGVTVNIGNFSSVRVDVWASAGYAEGEIDNVYEELGRFAEERVRSELDKVIGIAKGAAQSL